MDDDRKATIEESKAIVEKRIKLLKEKLNVFGKIGSPEKALEIIKGVVRLFYVVGGIEILLGFMLGMELIVDGVIIIILAVLLNKLKSRIVACLLALMACTGAVVTFLNLINETGAGRNIILAIIVAIASIRALQATFVYQRANRS